MVRELHGKHGKNCDIAVASYAKQFLGPNVIFMRDVYGNNALHLCVMRCKVEMYKHVLEKADAQLRIEIRAAYLKEVDQVHPYNTIAPPSPISSLYPPHPLFSASPPPLAMWMPSGTFFAFVNTVTHH